jgi:hypothetical protein
VLCESCRIEVTREQAFDAGDKHYCQQCFFKLAEPFRANLTPEQKRYLRELIKEEMEGVLPRAVLHEVIAESVEKIVARKVDAEEEINHIVNRVEQVAGLAMFKQTLTILEELIAALEGQVDELRNRIRKLVKL